MRSSRGTRGLAFIHREVYKRVSIQPCRESRELVISCSGVCRISIQSCKSSRPLVFSYQRRVIRSGVQS
jgi:hypothetical protein